MNVLHLLFIAVFTSENGSGSSIQSVRAVAFSFLHSLNENIVVFLRAWGNRHVRTMIEALIATAIVAASSVNK